MRENLFLRALAVILIITFSTSLVFSQSIERINENIGGGSKPVQSDSKNSNTFLYIAAGVVVVGLVVWKVLSDRKDSKQKNEGKTDSTKVSLNENFFAQPENYLNDANRIQHLIPADIFLGFGENERETKLNKLTIGLRIKL